MTDYADQFGERLQDKRATGVVDDEDPSFSTCNRCAAEEAEAENRSLEAAETGAGREKLLNAWAEASFADDYDGYY